MWWYILHTDLLKDIKEYYLIMFIKSIRFILLVTKFQHNEPHFPNEKCFITIINKWESICHKENCERKDNNYSFQIKNVLCSCFSIQALQNISSVNAKEMGFRIVGNISKAEVDDLRNHNIARGRGVRHHKLHIANRSYALARMNVTKYLNIKCNSFSDPPFNEFHE